MELPPILEDDKAKFNSGLPIIYRLHEIHRNLHQAKLTKDHEAYYPVLIAFFMEIVRFTKQKETEMLVSSWEKAKVSYFKIRALNKDKKSIPAGLYEDFYYWELQLTKFEQRYNVGMPTREDAGL